MMRYERSEWRPSRESCELMGKDIDIDERHGGL